MSDHLNVDVHVLYIVCNQLPQKLRITFMWPSYASMRRSHGHVHVATSELCIYIYPLYRKSGNFRVIHFCLVKFSAHLIFIGRWSAPLLVSTAWTSTTRPKCTVSWRKATYSCQMHHRSYWGLSGLPQTMHYNIRRRDHTPRGKQPWSVDRSGLLPGVPSFFYTGWTFSADQNLVAN